MSAASAKSSKLVMFASFLVGVFTRNLGAKIAALILALLVWFTVRQDITQEVRKTARIRLDELTYERLMVVGKVDPVVDVTFSGPSSQIDKIRGDEAVEVWFRGGKKDLVGEDRRLLEFSLQDGNVEHLYGDEVIISKMEPARVRLEVAIRAERTVPVREPTIRGGLKEWTKVKITFTEEITVTGPKDRIDALEEIIPQPIIVEGRLEGNGDSERIKLPGTLGLSDALTDDMIRPVGNQKITYEAEFRRSRITESITLPFVVKYERQNSKVSLEINPSALVKRQAEGFTIDLMFTGSRADLDRVIEGAKAKTIRAFVRAEDYPKYVAEEAPASGPLGPVRLEMPDDLFRRVAWLQPGIGSIEVRTEKR